MMETRMRSQWDSYSRRRIQFGGVWATHRHHLTDMQYLYSDTLIVVISKAFGKIQAHTLCGHAVTLGAEHRR
jgi:hypothetical protein